MDITTETQQQWVVDGDGWHDGDLTAMDGNGWCNRDLNAMDGLMAMDSNLMVMDSAARHQWMAQWLPETAALRSLLMMEIEDEDRLLQSKINELKTQVADSLKRLDREHHSTLNLYERDCQVLTGRMRKEDVNRERDWQKRVNLWVGKTSRASSVGGRHTLNNSSANSDRRIEKMNVPSEADNEVVN